jgi:mycofactocin glycosyltransferase
MSSDHTTSGSGYRLDGSCRRLEDGTVLLGGSPLSMFRLTPDGARVVDRIVAGLPLRRGHQVLTERLVRAGAIHPAAEGAGRAGVVPSAVEVTLVIPALGASTHELARIVSVTGARRAVIVDDGSPLPIGPVAGAEVVRLNITRGPGAARNAGLALVTTSLVAFVDSDVEVGEGWLDPLLAHLTDPNVAFVAPRVRAARGDRLLERFERWRSPLDLGPTPARVTAGSRVSYVPAAAIVARSDAVRAVGGFDERLRFGEDVDLVWRLDQAGRIVRYEPAVEVHHRTRSTFVGWLRQRIDYGSSAAPLAVRHPGALAPTRTDRWSAIAWAAGVLHPLGGVAVACGTIAVLARRLGALQQPWRVALRLAGLGHLGAGRLYASALVRAWWPFALVACMVSRRARRATLAALVVPALADWVRDQPSVSPPAAVALRTLDDLAYGVGLWQGMLAEATFEPIRPVLSSTLRRAPHT